MLTLLVAVLPSLAMLWSFPEHVNPGNYIPIAPSMLGMFALPVIVRGWRPSLLRMIAVYSVAHVLAAIDAWKENFTHKPTTPAFWVPSGANSKTARTKLAGRIVRTWYVVTQSLIWTAIIRDVPVYGWHNYWPAVVLSIFQTIVLFPLILPGYGTVAQATLLPHFARGRFRRWRRDRYYRRSLPLSSLEC